MKMYALFLSQIVTVLGACQSSNAGDLGRLMIFYHPGEADKFVKLKKLITEKIDIASPRFIWKHWLLKPVKKTQRNWVYGMTGSLQITSSITWVCWM